jgi:peptidoglycan/LPS O-acetylase OafA/YrhL
MPQASFPQTRAAPGPPHLASVQGLRGIAAIAVALFHFTGQMSSVLANILHEYGWLGVDIFFVISGFIIPYSLQGKGYTIRSFPNFMARRMVRIEPPYVASIAFFLLLWEVTSRLPYFRGAPPDWTWGQVLFHLLYLIPVTSYHWITPVYWSLAYEFVFYVVIGLSFSFIIRNGAGVTIAMTTAALAVMFYWTGQWDARILEFGLGVILMRYMAGHDAGPVFCFWMVVLAGTIGAIAGIPTVVAVILTAMVILVPRTDPVPGAYFFGAISYSLYLIHVPVGGRVVNFGLRYGDGPLFEAVLIMAALLVSILFAQIFAKLVEVPSIRAAKKLDRSAPERRSRQAKEALVQPEVRPGL